MSGAQSCTRCTDCVSRSQNFRAWKLGWTRRRAAFLPRRISSGASTATLNFSSNRQAGVHEFEKEKKKKEEKQIGRNDDVRALHRPKPLFAKLAVCCLTRGRAPVTTGPKKGIPRFGESPTTRSLDPDYSLIFTKRCHRLFFGVGLPSCVYRNNQRLCV